MIELRWVRVHKTRRELQYRFITPCVDASGALCPGNGFGEWQDVPEIDSNDLAWEDLGRSGGLGATYTDHLPSSASETEVLQGNAESPSSSDLNATGGISRPPE